MSLASQLNTQMTTPLLDGRAEEGDEGDEDDQSQSGY